MKKILFFVFFTLSFIIINPPYVYAKDIPIPPDIPPPDIPPPEISPLTLPGGYTIQYPLNFKGFNTIGDIINALIPYIFALAGIILLFLIIFGGFELLTSGGNPKKVESGKGKITHAIIGFIIIFVAYWLVQILETIFGIKIF